MLRIASVIAFLLALTAVVGCNTRKPGALNEEAGGFSYDPPAGWAIKEMPGLKYRIAAGPASGGFAPNINVVDAPSPGSLDAFADGNVEEAKRILRAQVLVREPFTTASGEKAVRAVLVSQQLGFSLRQTFYIFGSPSHKYVVTCSALANGGEALDATFAASMKTFQHR